MRGGRDAGAARRRRCGFACQLLSRVLRHGRPAPGLLIRAALAPAPPAGAPRQLYTVLEQKQASVGAGALMGSDHTYVIPGKEKEGKAPLGAKARLEALRREMPSDVDVSIDPAVRVCVSCRVVCMGKGGLIGLPGFAEATRLCLPAGAQRLHSVPKCSVQFRADWHPAPVWPALPRRSWRAWTTLRCATCTRCGLRSSVRRRGARTFRVRRPQRCQLEAPVCLTFARGQRWSASAAVGAHFPLPRFFRPACRPGGGQGGAAEAQGSREGGQGGKEVQVLSRNGTAHAIHQQSFVAPSLSTPFVMSTSLPLWRQQARAGGAVQDSLAHV